MSRYDRRIRRSSHAALAVAVLAVPLNAQNLYADASWAAPVSGSYTDPAMWNPPQVPGLDDFLTFGHNATYTVTVAAAGLEMNGAHIAAGDVTWEIASGASIFGEYFFHVAQAGETATFRLTGPGTFGQFESFIGVGAGTNGSMYQSAGQLLSADWSIGGSNGIGTYMMSGGTLSTQRVEIGGVGGTGQFVQSGGHHGNSYDLNVGPDAGIGTYSLSGSATLTCTRHLNVFDSSLFTQSGNSTNTVSDLSIWGQYNLTGGSLIVPEVSVGGGKGTFNFSGGSADIEAVELTTGGRFNVAADGNRVLPLKNLQIDAASKLDLADNKLIVSNVAVGTWDGAAYTGIAGMVDRGRGPAGNALWNGSGIVTSDTRAINTGDLVSIGVAKVGDLKNIADTATTTFAGQTVTGSDTVAMATWGGDADLDGEITIDDYGRIDSNVNQSGSVFGWFNGDFNYDGKINIDDYGIIDGNINRQGAPFSTTQSPPAARLAAANSVATVPDPLNLSFTMLAVLTLHRRRRRALTT